MDSFDLFADSIADSLDGSFEDSFDEFVQGFVQGFDLFRFDPMIGFDELSVVDFRFYLSVHRRSVPFGRPPDGQLLGDGPPAWCLCSLKITHFQRSIFRL